MDDYTDRICKEIILKEKNLGVGTNATIYFGGGTPSLLPCSSIKKIAETLQKEGYWHNNAEATIEVNPGTVDKEKLKFFKDIGFTRISFGVQSLIDQELKAIGRIHSAKEAVEAIKLATELQYEKINADLIYGLPSQTKESLQVSLDGLKNLGIKHISVYGLTVEEDTPLAKMIDDQKIILPDEDTQLSMYKQVIENLTQAGFERYEISNFAKIGYEAQHNLVYWEYLPYQAFGCAACSFNGKERFTGELLVANYMEAIAQNKISGNSEMLSDDELVSECILMVLRTQKGINYQTLMDRFNVDILKKYDKDLQKFIKQGHVKIDCEKHTVSLTEQGMRYSNQVFEIFVK